MSASGVRLTGLDGCSAAGLCWRRYGRLHVTVIVRGTYALVASGMMQLVRPEPIVVPAATPFAGGPHDLVPFRKSVDVWARGHVRPVAGHPSWVRLVVYRNGVMAIDKTVEVAPGAPAGVGMPLVGLGPEMRAAPFEVQEAIVAVPDTMSLEALQWAPRDQRLDLLHGDEWIAVSGLDEEPASFASQLPLPKAEARAYRRPPATGFEPIPLLADSLELDLDRRVCSVVWRGTHVIGPETTVRAHHFVAGIASGSWSIAWIDPLPASAGPARTMALPARPAPDPVAGQPAPPTQEPPSSGVPDPLAATMAAQTRAMQAMQATRGPRWGAGAASRAPEGVPQEPRVAVDPLARTLDSGDERAPGRGRGEAVPPRREDLSRTAAESSGRPPRRATPFERPAAAPPPRQPAPPLPGAELLFDSHPDGRASLFDSHPDGRASLFDSHPDGRELSGGVGLGTPDVDGPHAPRLESPRPRTVELPAIAGTVDGGSTGDLTPASTRPRSTPFDSTPPGTAPAGTAPAGTAPATRTTDGEDPPRATPFETSPRSLRDDAVGRRRATPFDPTPAPPTPRSPDVGASHRARRAPQPTLVVDLSAAPVGADLPFADPPPSSATWAPMGRASGTLPPETDDPSTPSTSRSALLHAVPPATPFVGAAPPPGTPRAFSEHYLDALARLDQDPRRAGA